MSVQRNVIANYLASGWSALVGVAFIPIYIRYLGIESYGLIGFFATLQAWLLLLDLGLAPALNRQMARHRVAAVSGQFIRDLLKSVEMIYLATACVIAVSVAALSHLIAGYWLKAQALSAGTVTQAVLLMGLVISLQWMTALYRSALLGLQRQVWLSAASAVGATVRAIGAVLVLALVSPTIVAFLLFQGAVGAVESLVLGAYLRKYLPRSSQRPRFSLKALRTIAPFAGGLAAGIVLATMLTQVDKLLLARLLPLDRFGYFTLAVNVAGALAALIVPINNVAYPRFSELVAMRDEATLAQQYHRFAQLLSIGLIPPALVLCLFSGDILLLWTGDAGTAHAVAPLLSVWVIGTAMNGLMHVPYAAQLAHGWPRLSAQLNIVAVLLMVPAVLVLVPHHGAIAAAWIWVAINAGYMVFGIAAMHRKILIRQKWAWYGHDILSPLTGAAAAASIMWVLHETHPGMTRPQEAGFFAAGTLMLTVAAALASPQGRLGLRSGLERIYFHACRIARKSW